jgi:acetolactate synthase I/II/III large subunit
MSKMTGAQAVIESLVREGVTTLFGYPGGAIMPTYDALYDANKKLRHILVRHEQGAAHAAEGYARMTGEPGVCIATSGPGATNLVTGIADAMLDSIPMVCITGQVSSWALGTDAFQEADVIGVTIPITKWNNQVTKASDIPVVIAKAFAIARSGRPGPVLVDITRDAQTGSFEWDSKTEEAIIVAREEAVCRLQTPPLQIKSIEDAASVINNAERPLLLVGHGVLLSRAIKEVQDFAEKAQIPVALTLHGLSAFPTAHPLYVGMLGMHGNYAPNLLTNKADVIIAVGMRFDDRVTGDTKAYATSAKVVHIEIDPSEIGKVVATRVGIIADAKSALQALIPKIDKVSPTISANVAQARTQWLNQFRASEKEEFDKVINKAIHPTSGALKMSEVIHALSEITEGKSVIVADVGQHQMMAARYYRFAHPDSWVTSGGLGTMGFCLPAAMGVKVASPDREVISISGDGGFQMNLQELMTIVQEDIPVKIIILNNFFLGMVRQWQELFFKNRYSFVDMATPDFVKLGDAYGIHAARVTERGDLHSALKAMMDHPKAYLLEVVVEAEQNVFPMVPSGASVADVRLE